MPRLFHVCALALLSTLACAQDPATEAPTDASRALPTQAEREQMRQERLAAASDADAVRWLEANGQRFLALYSAEYSGGAKGGVLILHDLGRHVAWPDSITRLRQQLPLSGWHSLAISLAPLPELSPPPRVLPARGEAAKAAPGSEDARATEAANATAPAVPAVGEADPVAAVMVDNQARIAAAIAFFNDLGVYNLVIVGEGGGALEAAEYVASMSAPAAGGFESVQGLVMVDPDHNLRGHEQDLPALIRSLRIPVLDISTRYDRRAQDQARERQLVSRSLPRTRYQQLRMPPPPPNRDDAPDRLTQRITGWIDNKLAGEEIGAS